jgi:hypothetical protein
MQVFIKKGSVAIWRSPGEIDNLYLGGSKIVTAGTLKEWINFLVDNTFISFAGKVYKQTIGIPMGTNCAGLLANLYLYTFELEFMEKLIAANDLPKLVCFVHTCRYIDDVCAIDNPFFRSHMYQETSNPGIYPKASLTLKLTSDSHSCNYLDLSIVHNKRGWRTKIYDKRLEPQFKMIKFIRFPAIDSAISNTAKYGVVLSQLHRFSRLCSHKTDFTNEVANLLHALIRKGYDKQVMLRQVHYFLQQRPQLYASSTRGRLQLQLLLSLTYLQLCFN